MFPGLPPDARPVYGALNLAGYPDGRLGPALRWSPSFRLRPDAFPAALRGPEVPPLARFVAARYGAAALHAEVIGRAARSVVRHPAGWSSFGTPAEVLQLIKYLWHILVLRGEAT
jgi:hypothetical protein